MNIKEEFIKRFVEKYAKIEKELSLDALNMIMKGIEDFQNQDCDIELMCGGAEKYNLGGILGMISRVYCDDETLEESVNNRIKERSLEFKEDAENEFRWSSEPDRNPDDDIFNSNELLKQIKEEAKK